MNSKAAQYLNEIVSLSILVLMIVALAAGQADASRMAQSDTHDRPDRYAAELAPAPAAKQPGSDVIVDVLTISAGGLDGRHRNRPTRPAGAAPR